MNSSAGVEWPDWTGGTVVIVGTGPSAADTPLMLAKGKAKSIVIKSAWKLAPWADVLYGVDKGWWIANSGARVFTGLKVSPSPTVQKLFPGVLPVRLRPFDRMLSAETGIIGCGLRCGGGFAGFQTMNLAIQWGAKRLILVGFDMTLENGAHWTKDYRGVARPDPARTASWREALDGCAGQLRDMGIEVLNASVWSALRNYPKVRFADMFPPEPQWPSQPAWSRSSGTSPSY